MHSGGGSSGGGVRPGFGMGARAMAAVMFSVVSCTVAACRPGQRGPAATSSRSPAPARPDGAATARTRAALLAEYNEVQAKLESYYGEDGNLAGPMSRYDRGRR
jgi:hypothetical protein